MATLFGDQERYPGGLMQVAPGVHAWLQPNGAWGESNAGLVVGAGESLLIERFAKDVTVVRAWPRPLAMMQGIDETFAAVMFIGTPALCPSPCPGAVATIGSL